MSLTYDVNVPERLVILRAAAYSAPDEWFEVMAAAIADPRFGPGFDFLYDRRRVDHVPDAMYVRSWVFRHAEMMKPIGLPRLAVVVTQPVVYGMIRMASVFAESAGAAVDAFWTEREALEWLGRNPNTSAA